MKSNKLQLVNLEYDVCEYIIEGFSRTEIINKVLAAYPNLKEHNVVAIYEKAKLSIVDRVSTDIEKVVDLHIKWYEQIWRYFEWIDNVAGKRNALKQKEKILGLLKEDNIININNEINLNLTKSVKYDLNKLTPEERERFEGYLKLVDG